MGGFQTEIKWKIAIESCIQIYLYIYVWIRIKSTKNYMSCVFLCACDCCVFRRCMKMPLYANKLFILKLHQIFIQKFNFYVIGGWVSPGVIVFHFISIFASPSFVKCRIGVKHKHKVTPIKKKLIWKLVCFFFFSWIVRQIWVYFVIWSFFCTYQIECHWSQTGGNLPSISWTCLGVIICGLI